jgi:hypothetical protein
MNGFECSGREIRALSVADDFHRWILDCRGVLECAMAKCPFSRSVSSLVGLLVVASGFMAAPANALQADDQVEIKEIEFRDGTVWVEISIDGVPVLDVGGTEGTTIDISNLRFDEAGNLVPDSVEVFSVEVEPTEVQSRRIQRREARQNLRRAVGLRLLMESNDPRDYRSYVFRHVSSQRSRVVEHSLRGGDAETGGPGSPTDIPGWQQASVITRSHCRDVPLLDAGLSALATAPGRWDDGGSYKGRAHVQDGGHLGPDA